MNRTLYAVIGALGFIALFLLCTKSQNPFLDPDRIVVGILTPAGNDTLTTSTDSILTVNISIVLKNLVDQVQVNFGDSVASTLDSLGSHDTLQVRHAYSQAGTYTITVTTFSGDHNKRTSCIVVVQQGQTTLPFNGVLSPGASLNAAIKALSDSNGTLSPKPGNYEQNTITIWGTVKVLVNTR